MHSLVRTERRSKARTPYFSSNDLRDALGADLYTRSHCTLNEKQRLLMFLWTF